MNKIYKSLFNSVTRTWVAVPEISKNHASGKSCKSRKLVTAAVGVAITVGSLVGQFALMDEAEAINWTHWRCGGLIGGDGKLSTAYLCGGDHDESGKSIPMIINTAVGFNHNGSNTTAHHLTGFGYANRFYQHIGVGIGGRNEIHSLGSVALGYQSVADRDYLGPDNGNTFNPASKVYLHNSPMVRQTIRGKMGAYSIGLRDIIRKDHTGKKIVYPGVTRQLINVAPGRHWSDAVNVAQLLAVENALKKYIDDTTDKINATLPNPIEKPGYTGNENHNGSLGDDKPDSNGVVGGEIPGPNNSPVLIDSSDNPSHNNPGGNNAGTNNPDDPNNADSPFNPNNTANNAGGGTTNTGTEAGGGTTGGGVAFKFQGNKGDAIQPKANSVVFIKGADTNDSVEDNQVTEEFDGGENVLTKLEKKEGSDNLILRIALRKKLKVDSDITVGDSTPKEDGSSDSSTKVEPGKITLTGPSDGSAENPANTIVIDAGTGTITGIKPTLPQPGDDATSGSLPENPNPALDLTRVASIADVLNSGFNLQANGTAIDFIRPYDTINFINGTGTYALLEAIDKQKGATVKFDVLTSKPKVDGNGKIVRDNNGNIVFEFDKTLFPKEKYPDLYEGEDFKPGLADKGLITAEALINALKDSLAKLKSDAVVVGGSNASNGSNSGDGLNTGDGNASGDNSSGVNGELIVKNENNEDSVTITGDTDNGGVIEIYGPNGKDGRDGTNGKDAESGLTLANDGISFHNIPGTKSDPSGDVDGKGDSTLSMTADTSSLEDEDKTPGTLDKEEGKPVTPRLVYTDPNNNNEKVFVATMNDGFRFGANTGLENKNPLATKLNSTVEIKGKDLAEGADTEKLWDDEFDQGENIMTRVEEKDGKTIIRVAMRKEIKTSKIDTNEITVGGKPSSDESNANDGSNGGEGEQPGTDGKLVVKNKDGNEAVVIKSDSGSDGSDGEPVGDAVGGVIELYGPNGKDGRDGKDGKPGEPGLTLTSKDITFHNIPGTKGKDGKDGTGSSSLSMDAKDTTPTLDNKEGEPKTPRIVYTDPNNPDKKVEVATMKDGLIFSGDDPNSKVKPTLNTELKITGGADINNVSENNISVAAVSATAENPTNEIKVRLSKDLKGLNSAQFVNGTHETIIKPEGIVISKVVPADNDSNGSNGGSDSGSDSGDSTGSGNGATVTKPVVEINENGLDLKGEGSITGLKPSSDPNSATTLGQVQEIVSNSEVNQWRNTRESTATAVAMANLPQAYVPGKSMVAIAGGNHEGKAAVAVGISTISSNGKWVLKGSMAKSKSKFSAGVGVGYQW